MDGWMEVPIVVCCLYLISLITCVYWDWSDEMWIVDFFLYWCCMRGAIKKFSAWPVRNVSYSSKAQNTTCTTWLLALNILCILAVVGCLHTTWKKLELHCVKKWQFWQISFVTLHVLLFWLRIEGWIHVSSWITSFEINFCWVPSVSFEKFFRNLCTVLVLPFATPSDRHFVHTLKCTKYL